MTGTLRSSARNPIAVALMGLLILVFLILGVGGGSRFPDAFQAARSDAVVTAGSHTMGAPEFRRIFDQQKQRFEQQTQQPVTTEFLVENGADQQILNQIALEKAGLEMLKRAGIAPGAALVDQEIKKLPFAFDRVTGKFSETQFKQTLAAQGLTVRDAQTQIADEVAQRHFAYALEAGYAVPRLYVALGAAPALETRDVSYFTIGIDNVVPPTPPTEAQLEAFMKAHAAQLTRPEMRVLTLVSFSAKALAPSIKVDPSDVEKEFALRKSTLSNPEKRTVIQIPVRSPADGAAAAQRLSKGEDPATIAISLGSQPVVYDDKPKTAIADPKLAAAAFSMTEGAVSGPVAGDLGLAAIKVVKVTPAAPATLETARPQIEADLRQKAAAKQAYDLSQKYDDARQGGSSLMEAARRAGAPTVTLGPVTAQGVGLDRQVNPLLSEKILRSAFSAKPGQDGDLLDLGSGEYAAVRVEKVTPPTMPALDEIRPVLTQAYMQQAVVTAVKAKADALVAAIKGGQSMSDAARTVGAVVAQQTGMQRLKAAQYKALGQQFLQGAFGAKPGETFAAGGETGVYIVKVDSAKPGDPQLTARLLQAVRPRASQAFAVDMLAAANQASLKMVDAKVNLPLARRAIGVDAATIAKLSAKPGREAK
jgi:peptidyl-prolyl cis-trans isomerase D